MEQQVDKIAEAVNSKVDIPRMSEPSELLLFKGLIFIILAVLLSFNTPLFNVLSIWVRNN